MFKFLQPAESTSNAMDIFGEVVDLNNFLLGYIRVGFVFKNTASKYQM